MKLDEISILNFKGLKSVCFRPTSFSCLVGENNAGKSTVLQAIATALNRPPQLGESAFYAPEKPIVFGLRFNEIAAGDLRRLAEEHRLKLEPLVVKGTLGITVSYTVGQKAEIAVLRRVASETRFQDETIDQMLKGKKGGAVRTAMVEVYPEFATEIPDGINITNAKAFISTKVAALPDSVFSMESRPLPSGISTSISALLPEPIYVPAVKDLSDDLKTTQSTSFGRLLGLLLEDMAPDLATVNDSLRAINKLFNRVMEDDGQTDDRHVKVRELERLVETLLKEHFPRVGVELHIPPPELRTILNAARIIVDDGSRDLIENKGDGIRRSLTFALLRAYVERIGAKPKPPGPEEIAHRPLIFLFEEPELYLHPRSQRVLFDALSRIATSHQVVVTTHSPLFFAPGVTAGFVRVAKRQCLPKPVGELHPVDFDLDPSKVEVFRLARFENADAGFFSGRAVLFEGESDGSFLEHVSGLLDPDWSFKIRNVALIRVSGKGNFRKFRQFFREFGIEVKLVADLDALFEGFEHLGSDTAASELRSVAIQTVDRRISEAGFTPGLRSSQVKDRVNQEGWLSRYETVKVALQGIRNGGELVPATIEAVDGLFAWEQDVARVRACRDDAGAAEAIIPLLDALRAQGICVLSRGAVEDYYPAGVPIGGSKPARALAAAKLVLDRGTAAGLSAPLRAGRPSELEEVFSEVFRGLDP